MIYYILGYLILGFLYWGYDLSVRATHEDDLYINMILCIVLSPIFILIEIGGALGRKIYKRGVK